jgi:hypothetical protein
MSQHCCERMKLLLTDGEGAAILYIPKFHEYGIPILDGPTIPVVVAILFWISARGVERNFQRAVVKSISMAWNP